MIKKILKAIKPILFFSLYYMVGIFICKFFFDINITLKEFRYGALCGMFSFWFSGIQNWIDKND